MEDLGIGAQRVLLAVLAGLVAAVFWSGLTDPVNLPKITVTAAVAIALVAIALVRVVVTRRLVLLVGPVVWIALALGLGLVVATATSDVPAASWTGTLGRGDGLLLYGSCLVCFLAVLRAFDAGSLRLLVQGLLVGGVVSVVYGLAQWADVDPVNWARVFVSPIIGTLGNPDFEAAYVGIMMPLAAWGVLTRTWTTPWRVASGGLGLGCVLVSLASSSQQGVLAGAAGLVVVAAALLLARGDRVGRVGLGVLLGAATLGAAVLALGLLAGIGPGERVTAASSLTARKWYWRSAFDMWQQHPLDGVGLDRFGAYYRSVRPAEAAAASNYSDAAHSVPLHLLATGGLLVALPYLALTLLVLVALVVGLRRLAGEERLLLAGVGGAWTAYQVQSVVSIDQPALAVTHWLLAGAVVVLAAPPARIVRLLPGAVVAKPAKRGRSRPVEPEVAWTGAAVAVTAVVTVLAVVSIWAVLTPLRADRAARAGAEHLAAGQGNAALDSFTTATERAPHVASYWLRQGALLEQVKQEPRAEASYADGLRHDPRSYDLLVAAAKLAKKQADDAAFEHFADELHGVDPADSWRSVVGD